MTDSDGDDESESETRELHDYHCVAAVEQTPDVTVGETERAVFDPDVVDLVYRELLDAIASDGYDLLAFGTLDPERRDAIDLHERFDHAPTATFVYRGVPSDD